MFSAVQVAHPELVNFTAVRKHCLANYTSVGDSGSPIIHKTSSVNTLVGVHTGLTCFYDSPTEGLDMITSGGRDDAGVCILGFFTPWESAKDALGFE